jgi:hypothetical protein
VLGQSVALGPGSGIVRVGHADQALFDQRDQVALVGAVLVLEADRGQHVGPAQGTVRRGCQDRWSLGSESRLNLWTLLAYVLTNLWTFPTNLLTNLLTNLWTLGLNGIRPRPN